MAARGGLFVLIILWSLRLQEGESRQELVIWNVGQGQWVTLATRETCWHFDTGGERAPWKAIQRLCRERANRISFSHWDWDHISFAGQVSRYLPNSCLFLKPQGKSTPRKERWLAHLPDCHPGGKTPFVAWLDPSARNANDQSRVVLWKGVLIPGDSSRREEKAWVSALQARGLSQVRWLVLGHHGSQTSTSEQLLRSLPGVEAAIATARERKYGHPHKRVREALHAHHIPLLRTEEWGSLHWDISND